MRMSSNEPLLIGFEIPNVTTGNNPHDCLVNQSYTDLNVRALIVVGLAPLVPPGVSVPVEVVIVRDWGPVAVGAAEADTSPKDAANDVRNWIHANHIKKTLPTQLRGVDVIAPPGPTAAAGRHPIRFSSLY